MEYLQDQRDIKYVRCGKCHGAGSYLDKSDWLRQIDTTTISFETKRVRCDECDGKGYKQKK